MSATADSEAALFTRFTQWAHARGIETTGIRSEARAGRGRGVFAERSIKAGERIAHVPSAALLNVPPSRNVSTPRRPAASTPYAGRGSVHGRLAARLLAEASGRDAKLGLWRDVMPGLEDVKASLPIMWDGSVRERLPEGAKGTLRKQEAKFEADWRTFSDADTGLASVLTGIDTSDMVALREQYMYHWLLVNTRCFYWDFAHPAVKTIGKSGAQRGGGQKKTTALAGLPNEECLAMCPFIDLFNHANEGIEASYNAAGYYVTADRDYMAGEEILFSYGLYTNDFLLVEYGFILGDSSSDAVCIDAAIEKHLNPGQRQMLEDANMLGNYTLQPPATLCHRTQCALRAMKVEPRRFWRFARGESDGEEEQAEVAALAANLLDEYRTDVAVKQAAEMRHLAEKGKIGAGACLQRWTEIADIIQRATGMLRKGPDVG